MKTAFGPTDKGIAVLLGKGTRSLVLPRVYNDTRNRELVLLIITCEYLASRRPRLRRLGERRPGISDSSGGRQAGRPGRGTACSRRLHFRPNIRPRWLSLLPTSSPFLSRTSNTDARAFLESSLCSSLLGGKSCLAGGLELLRVPAGGARGGRTRPCGRILKMKFEI